MATRVLAQDRYLLSELPAAMESHVLGAFALAAPGPDRVLEGVEHQRGLHRGGRPPAQDPPRVGLDLERHVRDVFGGRDRYRVSSAGASCSAGAISV
jgi:hypothetical protein